MEFKLGSFDQANCYNEFLNSKNQPIQTTKASFRLDWRRAWSMQWNIQSGHSKTWCIDNQQC